MPEQLQKQTIMNCGFTYTHYQEILTEAQALGYACVSFQDLLDGKANGASRILLLRHDIDFTVVNARHLAQIEHDQGATATYFVRLHALHYNPFALAAMRQLHEIQRLGSELGLHYEAPYVAALGFNDEDGLRREKLILETGLAIQVQGVCPHEVVRTNTMVLPDATVSAAGFRYQAYAPQFFGGFKYLSDSSARWREGCVCGWLGRQDRLYVLTHGFWWYDETPLENY